MIFRPFSFPRIFLLSNLLNCLVRGFQTTKRKNTTRAPRGVRRRGGMAWISSATAACRLRTCLDSSAMRRSAHQPQSTQTAPLCQPR
ncbi:hypothetical protein F5Y17DRAFT_445715 [Xylariaceae sp. FL0594]|nr:hypothetical protein F5Y17DRAFT_445715 [Xylariaceae sp. FL0594]